MIIIKNQKMPIDYCNSDVLLTAAKALGVSEKDINKVSIKKISIDARKKFDVHYVATIEADVSSNEAALIKRVKNCELSNYSEYNFCSQKKFYHSPVIVGSGPAGLFCALLLARNGAKPIIIERGETVADRSRTIENFTKGGTLNTKSNIQFGEGGAGTFSDGKLNTGTKDIRQSFVLKEFVAHGAPEDILINAKPHIGTDKLKETIVSFRREIESLGGIFKFNTTFTDFSVSDNRINSVSIESEGYKETIDTDTLVLAIGHSARDTYKMLRDKGVLMEQKAFSIGVRVEHKREYVNECQYGSVWKKLPSADYKVNTHLKNGRGVYSFCMCPGGYVVNASSEENMLCTNGMSLYARDAENSNSAILVSVNPLDYNCSDILDGIALQRKIENAAFNKTNSYIAPVETIADFLKTNSKIINKTTPSIQSGYEYMSLHGIFPAFIENSLKEGLFDLSKKNPIFADFGGVLTAAETRSSAPVRIIRDESMQSKSYLGLYPCGEGAGYAGGIMSAATDGLKCAEKILQ